MWTVPKFDSQALAQTKKKKSWTKSIVWELDNLGGCFCGKRKEWQVHNNRAQLLNDLTIIMLVKNQRVVKRTPTWTGPCFWSRFGTITRRGPTYQATWWEEPRPVIGHIGRVSGDGMVRGGRARSDRGHAPTMSRIQLHAFQRHRVLNALFVLMSYGWARAWRGNWGVRGHIFGWSGGKGEEVWARVASGQRGGRGWGVDGQRPRGTVVYGSFGERPEVPRGGTVVRADRFTSIEPRKRAGQQRWATHLTTCGNKRQACC